MRMFAHVMKTDADVNRRRTARRSVMLDATAHKNADDASEIVIHNLSQTGLLMEASAHFEVGEIFYLHLPEVGATPVQIRRQDGARYGCEFLAPVGKVAISAALLKSAFEMPAEELALVSQAKVAASRFFGDQVMPVSQLATPSMYAVSTALTVLVAGIVAVMMNGNLFIN